MMNKDEIQRMFSTSKWSISCGLVMNKDEIQLAAVVRITAISCGLVMNKDEIQHVLHSYLHHQVVVW